MTVQQLVTEFLKLSKADQQRVKRSIDAMLAEPEENITPPPLPEKPGGPPVGP